MTPGSAALRREAADHERWAKEAWDEREGVLVRADVLRELAETHERASLALSRWATEIERDALRRPEPPGYLVAPDAEPFLDLPGWLPVFPGRDDGD